MSIIHMKQQQTFHAQATRDEVMDLVKKRWGQPTNFDAWGDFRLLDGRIVTINATEIASVED